jgi:hypothetical protein
MVSQQLKECISTTAKKWLYNDYYDVKSKINPIVFLEHSKSKTCD